MLRRRGFLLLLGTAGVTGASGLWLPETGRVELPRWMVLELSGVCSFCEADGVEVGMLAGVLGRPARICPGCAALATDAARDEPFVEDEPALRPAVTPEQLDAAQRDRLDAALAELRRRDAHERARPAPAVEPVAVADLGAVVSPALPIPVLGRSDGALLRRRMDADAPLQAALARLRETSIALATTPSAQLDRGLELRHAEAAHAVSTLMGTHPGPRAVWKRRAPSALPDPPPRAEPEPCGFCDAPASSARLLVGASASSCEGCAREAHRLMADLGGA